MLSLSKDDRSLKKVFEEISLKAYLNHNDLTSPFANFYLSSLIPKYKQRGAKVIST